MTAPRPFTAEMPDRVAALPTDHRGYPVPWFVATIDGKPEFRVVRPGGHGEAVVDRKCWICGQRLGTFMAFTIGPMCAVNRNTAEPPSHRDCAVFAAEACPFLSKPHMRRREAGMPEGTLEAPGSALRRNPGVALVWVTKSMSLYRVPGDAGFLITVGDPTETLWFAEGRPATRAECVESIESGLPPLAAMAQEEGPRAERELARMVDDAWRLLPKAA